SGFFMGYFIIGLYLLSNIVDQFMDYFKYPLKENLVSLLKLVLNYFMLGMMLLGVSLINFWGIGLWQEIITQIVSPQNQSINEWQSINFKILFFFLYFLFCAYIIFFRRLL